MSEALQTKGNMFFNRALQKEIKGIQMFLYIRFNFISSLEILYKIFHKPSPKYQIKIHINYTHRFPVKLRAINTPSLPLIQFQRQTIGICKKHKPFPRQGIQTYWFCAYTHLLQMPDSGIQVLYRKRQMP